MISSLRGVTEKEGFLGLYKGNFAQMIRIFPYAAIQFMSFEQYKKVKKYCMLGILYPMIRSILQSKSSNLFLFISWKHLLCFSLKVSH